MRIVSSIACLVLVLTAQYAQGKVVVAGDVDEQRTLRGHDGGQPRFAGWVETAGNHVWDEYHNNPNKWNEYVDGMQSFRQWADGNARQWLHNWVFHRDAIVYVRAGCHQTPDDARWHWTATFYASQRDFNRDNPMATCHLGCIDGKIREDGFNADNWDDCDAVRQAWA